MRAFLALELPESIKMYLGKMSNEMSKHESEVRWVKTQNQHITVKFFGEITEDMKDRIIERLKEISGRFRPIRASLGEISGFPRKESARVIIVTLERGIHEMKRMYEILETEMEKIGLRREEREFLPHITLGRRKNPRPIRSTLDVMKMEFELKRLTLYKSTLRQDGPIYDPIFCINLDERGVSHAQG